MCYFHSDMIKSLGVTTTAVKRNYISLINEYCQKNGFSHSFVLADKHGPSHGPQWVWLTAGKNPPQTWGSNLNTVASMFHTGFTTNSGLMIRNTLSVRARPPRTPNRMQPSWPGLFFRYIHHVFHFDHCGIWLAKSISVPLDIPAQSPTKHTKCVWWSRDPKYTPLFV